MSQMSQLPMEQISETALEKAQRELTESLLPSRREYAHLLANIRRAEQKYKQVSHDLDSLSMALEMAKLKRDIEQYNSILTRQHNCNQMVVSLKSDHNTLTQRARNLKAQISNTESQIAEIQAEKTNRRLRIENARRRKYFYMALGVIDTTLLLNVIEYPVLQESILQHSQLPIDVRIKIKPVEVTAFALNRLPHMYVSTMDKYHQQLQTVQADFKYKIYDAVKRAIQALANGDPLHDSTPISEEVFCDRGGLLGRLRLLFNRKSLHWNEIPNFITNISQGATTQELVPETYGHNNRYGHIKKYLQRTKQRRLNNEHNEPDHGESRSPAENINIFPELYVLHGRLKFINVIEKLIVVAILHLMLEISISESEFAEVAVQVLNQMQPMYATSERGLDYLCRRFFKENFSSVLPQIRHIYAKSQYSHRPNSTPLDFEQLNAEYKPALAEISRILNRSDLTPENLVSAIGELMTN